MKHKKKHHARNPNMRRFSSFYWRRFCICLLAALAAGGMLFRNWYDETAWDITNSGGMWDSFFQEKFEDPEYFDRVMQKTGFDYEAIITPSAYDMIPSDFATLLFNPKTGEYHTSQPMARACTLEYGETKWYTCTDPETLRTLMQFDYHPHHLPYSLTGALEGKFYTTTVVDSIYVKGNEFRPAFIHKERYFEQKQIGESVDVSPADTDGWTFLPRGETKAKWRESNPYADGSEFYETDLCKNAFEFSSAYISSPPDNLPQKIIEQLASKFDQFYADYEYRLNARLQFAADYAAGKYPDMDDETAGERSEDAITEEEVRQLVQTLGNEMLNLSYIYNIERYACFGSQTVMIGGEQWKLMHFEQYHFWEQYIISLGNAALLLLLAAVLAALIWSAGIYIRYRKHFAIDEYRRMLTGTLAHDLKTPLTAISGYAENLREDTHADKRIYYSDAILQNTAYMDRIIADVLDLSKLETDSTVPRTQTDLLPLAQAMFEPYAQQLAERGITPEITGSGSMNCNAKMIEQALGNLAANAVRYTQEGGSIRVTVAARCIRIENDIPEDIPDAQALAEPFVKGDAARSSRTGSGLGLAIVSRIAALNGCKLHLRAENGVFIAELQQTKKHR